MLWNLFFLCDTKWVRIWKWSNQRYHPVKALSFGLYFHSVNCPRCSFNKSRMFGRLGRLSRVIHSVSKAPCLSGAEGWEITTLTVWLWLAGCPASWHRSLHWLICSEVGRFGRCYVSSVLGIKYHKSQASARKLVFFFFSSLIPHTFHSFQPANMLSVHVRRTLPTLLVSVEDRLIKRMIVSGRGFAEPAPGLAALYPLDTCCKVFQPSCY